MFQYSHLPFRSISIGFCAEMPTSNALALKAPGSTILNCAPFCGDSRYQTPPQPCNLSEGIEPARRVHCLAVKL